MTPRATADHAAGESARRTASIAELIDIHALEPDGLIVTGAGEYVRVIECEFVPNPITADPAQIAAIEDGWAALFAAIPDHQGLSLYAQTDPIPIDDAMREDADRVDRAITDDLAAGREDLARTRRRFLQAQRQSVSTAARGEQPAVQARYWVAVPWRPEIPVAQRFKDACSRPRPEHRTSWEAHQRAARESLHYTEQVAGLLAGMGIDPHIAGPVEILAGLWERLHPLGPHSPGLRCTRPGRTDRAGHQPGRCGRASPADPRRRLRRARACRDQRRRPPVP